MVDANVGSARRVRSRDEPGAFEFEGGSMESQGIRRGSRSSPSGQASSAEGPGQVQPLDIRAVGPPERFAGEQLKFPEWAFVMSGYIAMVRLFTQEQLEVVKNSSTPLRKQDMAEVFQVKATQLWYLLTQLLAGPALKILRQAEAL